jgi:hypothetical protein
MIPSHVAGSSSSDTHSHQAGPSGEASSSKLASSLQSPKLADGRNHSTLSEANLVDQLEHSERNDGTTAQIMVDDAGDDLYYRAYRSEAEDMEDIRRLVEQELSEP